MQNNKQQSGNNRVKTKQKKTGYHKSADTVKKYYCRVLLLLSHGKYLNMAYYSRVNFFLMRIFMSNSYRKSFRQRLKISTMQKTKRLNFCTYRNSLKLFLYFKKMSIITF